MRSEINNILPSEFKRFITVKKPVVVTDNAGGTSDAGFITLFTTYAKVEQMKTQEKVLFGIDAFTSGYKITMRYNTNRLFTTANLIDYLDGGTTKTLVIKGTQLISEDNKRFNIVYASEFTNDIPATTQTVMIPGVLVNSTELTAQEKIDVAVNTLHLTTMRDAIILQDFTDINGGGGAQSVKRKLDQNITVLCNLNWGEVKQPDGSKIPVPFPTNLTAYRAKLEAVQTAFPNRFAYAVIENEEQNTSDHAGSMEQYLSMLQNANDYFKPLGVKVTNGGIYGPGLEIEGYRYLRDNVSLAAATEFSACMTTVQVRYANNQISSTQYDDAVTQIRLLLEGYKTIGIAAVNIHPYEPLNPSLTNTQVLAQVTVTTNVIRRLCEYITWKTGLPVITNETGIRTNIQPALVTAFMTEWKAINPEYCVYFSGDSPDEADAKSLVNADGSIRATGQAFVDWVDANY